MTFPMFDTDWALLTSLTTPDSEYSVDGGGISDCTNEATAIGSTGFYTLDLTATEMTGDEIVIKVDSADSAIPHMEVLHPEPGLDSGVAQAGATRSITLRSGAESSEDDYYNGGVVEIVRGTGAGQIRSIVDYAASSQRASVDRDWEVQPDSTSVYIIHGTSIGIRCNSFLQANANVERIDDTANTAEFLALMYTGCFVSGSIDDSSPTTSDFDGDSELSSEDDFYNGMYLCITEPDDDLQGIGRRIENYTGSTKNFEFAVEFPATPTDGSSFVIYGHSG